MLYLLKRQHLKLERGYEMKKTYNVKPDTELDIVFRDGKKLNVVFNAKAMYHFNDFENGIKSLAEDVSQPEVCAKLLYIGSVENNKDMTIEKARELVCQLDIGTISNIIVDFQESMGTIQNEAFKELQKKTMMEFVTNLMQK